MLCGVYVEVERGPQITGAHSLTFECVLSQCHFQYAAVDHSFTYE